jgi:hypothetical protein
MKPAENSERNKEEYMGEKFEILKVLSEILKETNAISEKKEKKKMGETKVFVDEDGKEYIISYGDAHDLDDIMADLKECEKKTEKEKEIEKEE